MTIASEITRIKTNIDNAYTALEAKGATIPSEKNSANLASTVNTITGGGGVSDWLAYAVLNNNFELINSPSYSGTEYTFPNGVTSCGLTPLMQEITQKMQEMETEYQSKIEEITNSSLPEEEKKEQLIALGIEYQAIKNNFATYNGEAKIILFAMLYGNMFNDSSIVTFNSNELNDFLPGMLPFKVEYVSLPNVTTASFGISLGSNYIYIKEFSAPALEEIALNDAFKDSSLKKLYLNPQGTWGDCDYMCSGCTDLTEITIPPISNMNSSGANLYYMFRNCIKITNTGGIFSGITNISYPWTSISGLDYTFQGCTSLASTGLNNVTVISSRLNNTFQGCTSLTSTGLDNVASIDDYGLNSTFYGCTSLTSTGLDNVASIGRRGLSSTFQDCTSLTSVDFSNLTSIDDYGLDSTFYGCTSLTSLSFPKLNSKSFGSYKTQFYDMLGDVTGCTVHFPSNLESIMGSWSDVTRGFGGTNTTVLFDLPATT